MATLLLTALLVTLLLAVSRAGAHPAAKHPGGIIRAPLVHKIANMRSRTNATLKRKCRSRWPVGIAPAYRIPPELRTWVIDLWGPRLDRALAASSGCQVIPAFPWLALASCESGQRWAYNGPSGFDGGFQFLPSTWNSAKGLAGASGYAYAYQAPAYMQYRVARAWLGVTSWAQWPACSAALGLR